MKHLHLPPGGIGVLAMTAVMALDTSDQSAIGATAPQVRAAFDIGQTQIGVLATSSTLVGVVFTLPFGILADRVHRMHLLRATVAVWIAAATLVGSAPSFGLMLVAHAVLGLVTGAAGPLIASVVGDLVAPEERGRVYSSLLLGELIGSVVGLAVAGEIAALIGWREAFWSLAVIGALVFLMMAKAVEPPRGRMDDIPLDPHGDTVDPSADTPEDVTTDTRVDTDIADRDDSRAQEGTTPAVGDAAVHGAAAKAHITENEAPPTLLAALRILIRNRTLVLLVLASSLGYYFFAGVQTFAVSLLREAYGASAAVAPLLVLVIGLSLAVGVLIGGPVGDRLLARRPQHGRLPVLVVAFAGSLAFIVPALAATDLIVTMPLLAAGGILLGLANPPLDATRIDIVSPLLRGRAEAIRTAVKDGADASAPLLFGAVATAITLQPTFLIMTVTLGLALVFCVFAVRAYPRDAPALHHPDPHDGDHDADQHDADQHDADDAHRESGDGVRAAG